MASLVIRGLIPVQADDEPGLVVFFTTDQWRTFCKGINLTPAEMRNAMSSTRIAFEEEDDFPYEAYDDE